ncbi:MAG: tRNA-5-methyluridine(54) 2-sulfurtransferase [Methanonatronarchaeales archaeon]|nr:tRNA-5-methyluridine(54) 2-sulfurtransferase [Methanonatronarchaeales archaeon]
MECVRCDEESVVHQRYSGLHLCQAHFLEDVERKVRREIRSYGVDGDIVVGLSGGKDSAAALHLLVDVFGEWRDVEVRAVCVHEGISPYRDRGVEAARVSAEAAGIELEVVRMDEELGISMEEVDGNELTTCGYCGVFRRRVLNDAALEMGADWLATGHNLDDEAQTVLMNVLRGDGFRLSVQGGVPERISGLVPRIKPLRRVPEREVALYVRLRGLRAVTEECPFAESSFRSSVRDLLNGLESARPGTKYSVASLPASLNVDAGKASLGSCERCGHPSGSSTCPACRHLESVGAT